MAWRFSSLWSFSYFRRNFKLFFGRASGFTLVELLVVIGIIGILLSAALFILNPIGQIQKTNDAKRKSDLAQMQRALETYFNDTGKYPPSSTLAPTYRIVNLNNQTADWGTTLFSPYIASLPKDPKANQNYVYFASADRQSYWLYASLEMTNDRQFCRGPGDPSPCASLTTNGIATNACGGTCNFAVSSSNVKP
ncbi:MAG TPA: prepilin-type N-terminal cleavage/methylation domain-containing protein [Patescibacteria group bacterium]|nr:prepilin-type N-terminal cleavage/methylation domain-containing protein [Patescibacteria group bacterium]